MDLFHYNEAGEFFSATTAKLDPLETERQGAPVYLQPARSTFIAPPEAVEGKARIFIDGEWTYVEDHRGTVYLAEDGQPVDYPVLGPLPEELVSEPRPSEDHVCIDGQWVIDQAKVDARLAEEARIAARMKDISDSLPSWEVVHNKFERGRAALSSGTVTVAILKGVVLGLINVTEQIARVVYWLAKDKAE